MKDQKPGPQKSYDATKGLLEPLSSNKKGIKKPQNLGPQYGEDGDPKIDLSAKTD